MHVIASFFSAIMRNIHSLLLGSSWNTLHNALWDAIETTVMMVTITLLTAGALGLLLGICLYSTAPQRLYSQPIVYHSVNFIINIIRPIPFIILVAACGPLTLHILGTTIGTSAAVFVMAISASAAIARVVEQNLVTVDSGLLEAARSMGASRLYTTFFVLLPEALGPLILGYTFLTVGIVDMSAMAGIIGGGGLGDFAIQYGYNQYNWHITLSSTIIIIIYVQLIQYIGNYYSRKVLRK